MPGRAESQQRVFTAAALQQASRHANESGGRLPGAAGLFQGQRRSAEGADPIGRFPSRLSTDPLTLRRWGLRPIA
jgi:hypothetical protein